MWEIASRARVAGLSSGCLAGHLGAPRLTEIGLSGLPEPGATALSSSELPAHTAEGKRPTNYSETWPRTIGCRREVLCPI